MIVGIWRTIHTRAEHVEAGQEPKLLSEFDCCIETCRVAFKRPVEPALNLMCPVLSSEDRSVLKLRGPGRVAPLVVFNLVVLVVVQRAQQQSPTGI